MNDTLVELGERIAAHAAHLDAATHRLLVDIRAFDAGGGWFQQGCRSCAHWLSWRCGIGLGPAREHVRVARRLGELPLIDDALRTGVVSYSKVRAMTRVATPANEATLVGDAKLTTAAQLEAICRKYAMVQRHDANVGATDESSRRYVRQRDTADGMVKLEAMLHPDEAAIVWAALERIATERVRNGATERASQDVPAGTPPPVCAFDRAEALVAMAQDVVRGRAKQRSPMEVVVTITRPALAGDTDDPIEAIACLPDGGCLTEEAARRIACDAGVVMVTEDANGTPLSVGRKTRTIPAALKRALLLRDKTCRYPGCMNRVFLEGHHMKHWIHGGDTSLENMISICSHHHRYVHEYGYRIVLTGDGPQFFTDRGLEVKAVPPPSKLEGLGWEAIERGNANLGITAETPACGYDGEPIDYAAVIGDLARAEGLDRAHSRGDVAPGRV